jgi:hypothetical protein
MPLPKQLVSDSVKILRPYTDNGLVACHQGKHHKLSGYFKGRKWVFMIPCSPHPHYYQKIHQLKLAQKIRELATQASQ